MITEPFLFPCFGFACRACRVFYARRTRSIQRRLLRPNLLVKEGQL